MLVTFSKKPLINKSRPSFGMWNIRTRDFNKAAPALACENQEIENPAQIPVIVIFLPGRVYVTRSETRSVKRAEARL